MATVAAEQQAYRVSFGPETLFGGFNAEELTERSLERILLRIALEFNANSQRDGRTICNTHVKRVPSEACDEVRLGFDFDFVIEVGIDPSGQALMCAQDLGLAVAKVFRLEPRPGYREVTRTDEYRIRR